MKPTHNESESQSLARVVFAHGKESGPWGSKIQHLAAIAQALDFTVDSPNYSAMMNPIDRVTHLLSLAPQGTPLVLVGSSMGGYVSAMACERLQPDALLLMAPALYLDGYPGDPVGCPADTEVVHGWHDDIVPLASSIDFARARSAGLHIVDDGHRLADSIDFIGAVFARQLQRVRQRHPGFGRA
ncbi:YqiA/YcfP family alpha/beta fold hydrolase [Salinisphaera aquimarina]|uniref:YqiA/YcfP family alpha/beta fold hydrolase n=1 Tax=Salinisphaera aquimarina TaxID=2094031 RepID=A0ABV7ES49_9GAMM